MIHFKKILKENIIQQALIPRNAFLKQPDIKTRLIPTKFPKFQWLQNFVGFYSCGMTMAVLEGGDAG